MKRWSKVLLVLVVVIFSVGIACLITAWGMGVSRRDVKNAAKKYTRFVDGIWGFTDLDFFDLWDDDDWDIEEDYDDDWDEDVAEESEAKQEAMEEAVEEEAAEESEAEKTAADGNTYYEYPGDQVTKLDLEFTRANVVICPPMEGKEDKIVVMTGSKVRKIKERLKGHTLDFHCTGKTGKNQRKKNTGVEIYLPEGIQLDEVEIALGAGTLECNSPLNARSVELEVGGGSLGLSYILADELNVEVGGGKVDLDYVDAKKIDVEAGAGTVKMMLAGHKDEYKSEVEVAAGTVQLGSETYSGLANSHSSRPTGASRKIEIECAAGSIAVNFEEE